MSEINNLIWEAWKNFIILVTVTYFIAIPLYVWTLMRFYNTKKIIKNYYQDTLEINKVEFISKNYLSWETTWVTILYFWSLFIITAIDLPKSIFLTLDTNNNIFIILFFSFFILYLLTYIVIILIWRIKLRKNKIVNLNKEVVLSFKSFFENWKLNQEKIIYFPLEESKYKKQFEWKQNKFFKNFNSQKMVRGLSSKNSVHYNDQDWNKYVSLFARYLYYTYRISRKWSSYLNNQEKLNLKISIINTYLIYTL
jgi:hypothetical protein